MLGQTVFTNGLDWTVLLSLCSSRYDVAHNGGESSARAAPGRRKEPIRTDNRPIRLETSHTPSHNPPSQSVYGPLLHVPVAHSLAQAFSHVLDSSNYHKTIQKASTTERVTVPTAAAPEESSLLTESTSNRLSARL